MPVCELTIPNEDGLHARPAAKFVKLASRFNCDVWVEKDDEEINGKSIMGLMMLAAAQGSVIRSPPRGGRRSRPREADCPRQERV